MSQTKMSRKELRAPDAFQKAGTEAREWVESRRQTVLVAVAAVVVVGAGIALAHYLSQRNEERSAKDLGGVLKVLQRPVAGQGSPSTAEEDEPPFKTTEEKDTAVVSAMEGFRSSHRGASAARQTATLTLAEAQLRLKRYDDALKAFDEYLAGSGGGDLLRASALEGKGYAYEGKSDPGQALQAFDEMSREGTADYLAGMGMYQRARMLALMGKRQEAADAFAEVQSKFSAQAAGRLSGEQLALLANEGVTPGGGARPGSGAAAR